MAININPLQQLKDIHLPAPISMWPQAPGWYIVAAILLILIVIATLYSLRKYLIHKRRKQVRSQLNEIFINFSQDPKQSFMALSQLIRRIVLAHYKREQVASLQGEAWLKFLDETCETKAFCHGVGRVLITAPYQKQVQGDIHLLRNLVEKLINKVL